MFNSRSRHCEFEPHQGYFVVSLSKTFYALLSTGSTKEDLSQHDCKIVDLDRKNKKKLIAVVSGSDWLTDFIVGLCVFTLQ